MTVKLTGDWAGLSRKLMTMSSPAIWHAAVSKAMGREAHRMRSLFITNFNRQHSGKKAWKKLARKTIALRRAQGFRGKKALMRTGDLRNSIKVVAEGTDWFVGVHRTEKNKTGESLVDIASVQELGSKGDIKIPVTEKMRRFYMAMFLKSTTVAHRKRMARAKRTGKPGKGRMPKYAIMPLAKSTTVLVVRIPARPFIGDTWDKEKDRSAKNIIRGTLQNMGLGSYVR